jgi:divalent metal cation (Fe/Co/Zn/Cd) transporter
LSAFQAMDAAGALVVAFMIVPEAIDAVRE